MSPQKTDLTLFHRLAVKLCEAPVMKPGLFSVFAQKLPGKKFGKWGKIR
jgi:hypothetical protein